MPTANSIKSKGFTIIEAIVSMALFAIAFSGLYFFFGMAQQANNNSEKRMYLNLMGNQILETIHAEAFRGDDDVANPFVTPTSYTANLSDCSTYTAPDVRHTWCTELDASIGPHKGVHADELRTVEVIKDETNLIVNVTLVADGGTGSNNLIKTFLSRKIAPPRRSTPPEACVERHNEVVAHVKSEMAKCDAGTVPFITVSTTTATGVLEYKLSCPDYIMSGSAFAETLPGLLGKSIMDGSYRTYLAMTFFTNYVVEKYWRKGDPLSTYYAGHTSYGPDYPWTPGFGYGVAGSIWIAGSSATDSEICEDNPGINNMYLPKVKCNIPEPQPPIVNVFSCCPQEKITSGSGSGEWSTGRYKKCNGAPKSNPTYYVPYMGDGFDFSR